MSQKRGVVYRMASHLTGDRVAGAAIEAGAELVTAVAERSRRARHVTVRAHKARLTVLCRQRTPGVMSRNRRELRLSSHQLPMLDTSVSLVTVQCAVYRHKSYSYG